MSAVYGGIELCQTTPEVRAWIERNIPIGEHTPFVLRDGAPAVFSRLTTLRNNESHIPFLLNVLRWPSGASRWATYNFIATDQQLVDLRALCYGDEDLSDPYGSTPQKLILHGGGDVVECDALWMLPPRPVSATQLSWTRANKMWLVTLVDQRYWLNHNHCGEMAEEDVGTWDDMLDYLRDRAEIDVNSWDCPAVHEDWLNPHIDLTNVNSLPLGMMLDAVAWNVGRRISFDMKRTTLAYPPKVHVREWDWHNTRLQDNLTNPDWKRLAGGEFAFTGRDLSAILPEKIRVTFSEGTDPRRDDEVTVNTIAGYTDQNGTGVMVFHDKLDWGDVDDGQRTLLINRIADAYLGFQSKATPDVVYTGHVAWLPEALSDAIEWHEQHGEGNDLIPDPTDGKVRQRKVLLDMSRTRVVRGALNQIAEDLWHGFGSGSGSGSSSGGGDDEMFIDCGDGVERKVIFHGDTATLCHWSETGHEWVC